MRANDSAVPEFDELPSDAKVAVWSETEGDGSFDANRMMPDTIFTTDSAATILEKIESGREIKLAEHIADGGANDFNLYRPVGNTTSTDGNILTSVFARSEGSTIHTKKLILNTSGAAPAVSWESSSIDLDLHAQMQVAPTASEADLKAGNYLAIDGTEGTKRLDFVNIAKIIAMSKNNIVNDTDFTFTIQVNAGVTKSYRLPNIFIASGQTIVTKVVRNDSVVKYNGSNFLQISFDGLSFTPLGGAWPGYDKSYTDDDQRPVVSAEYVIPGNNIISDGYVELAVKISAVCDDFASVADVENLKNLIASNGLITFTGAQKNDWAMTSGGYIKADGTVVNNSSFRYSEFIEVFGNSSYTLVAGGNMYNTNQPIVFYNDKRNVIGTYTTSTTDTTRTFTTPAETKFIRYSCSGNSAYSLTYNGEPVSTIPDEIENLKNIYDVIKIPKIYGVVGTPIRLYLESLFRIEPKGIVPYKRLGSGDMDMRNSILLNLDSPWSYTTQIAWYDGKGRYAISTDMPFSVCNSSSKSGASATCMVIGDSLTASGKITKFLKEKFEVDVFNVRMVGTIGAEGEKHEGRAGWNSHDYRATASYNGSSNPFLNNDDFDFSYYLQNSGLAAPDYVVIELGTNDAWRTMGGSTTSDNISAMIESIKLAKSDVKIIVMTAACPYSGADATEGTQYYPRQGLWKVSSNVVDSFVNRENENIYCCLMGGIYDPIYSFTRTMVPACLHSDETIVKCTDRIHPSDVGYRQIADELYCAIKNI